MRIRYRLSNAKRVLRRRPERRRIPSSARDADGDNPPAESLTWEPIPSRDAPTEFHILGAERGLHKYTTGTFFNPYSQGHFRNYLSSFKLWSQGPLVGSALENTARLQTHFRMYFAGPTPGNLPQAFAFLYNVATRAAKAHDNVQGTFAQIIAKPTFDRSRKFLRGPSGERVLFPYRCWALSCLITPSKTGQSSYSRPFFSMQSDTAVPNRYIQTAETHWPLKIKWSIGGFLKPDIACPGNGNVSGPKTARILGDELQLVADAYFQGILGAGFRRRFTTIRDAVTAIRLKLQAIVPVSAITSALDMHSLEVTCALPDGSRYVDSVLLNDDGTVKHKGNQDDTVSEIKEPDPKVGTKAPENPTSAHKNSQCLAISALAKRKLDISLTLQIRIFNDGQAIGGNNLPEWTQVRDNFDLACRTSQHVGLRCFADAIDETSRSLAPHTTFRIDTHYYRSMQRLLPADGSGSCVQMSIFAQSAGDKVHEVGLVYIFRDLVCKPLSGHDTNMATRADWKVKLFGRTHRGRSGNGSNSDHTIRDEIVTLRDTTRSVLSRICEEITFGSGEVRISALAEAMLRVVDFQTPSILLSKVEIMGNHCDRPQKTFDLFAKATWGNGTSGVPQGLAKELAAVTVDVQNGPGDNAAQGHAAKDLDEDGDDKHEIEGAETISKTLTSTQPSLDQAVEQSTRIDNRDSILGTKNCSSSENAYTPFASLPKISESGEQHLKPTPGSSSTRVASLDSNDIPEEHHSHDIQASPKETEVAPMRKHPDRWEILVPLNLVSEAARQKVGADYVEFTASWLCRRQEPDSQQRQEISKKIMCILNQEITGSIGNGIFCLLRAAESIFARLPLEPSVSFSVLATARETHGARFTIRCLNDDFRRAKRAPLICHLRPVRVALGHEELARSFDEQDAHTYELLFRLAAHDLHLAGNAGISVSAAFMALTNAVTKIVEPIVRAKTFHSLKALADGCGTAILESPRPFADLLHLEYVRTLVRTIGSDGTTKASEWSRISSAQKPAAEEQSATGPLRVWQTKYLALGSNVGNRLEAIEAACRLIDASGNIRIHETSPLYETKAMYVEEQEQFLNGVCKISTELQPIELLDKLQSIENALGRVKLVDKGPRNIDLDILIYDGQVVQSDRLTVPHRLMMEREFVLRPLCDTTGGWWKHPETMQTARFHLDQLPPSSSPMFPVTPLGAGCDQIRSQDPKRRTHVMSILNVTPDSFSDGGDNQGTDMDALRATISSHIAAGATIIDIGGQSSRPNAPDVTAEEEIARILPAIEAIKSLPEAKSIAISIDTYRASVAEAAIKAGAHIINDISAGQLDPEMLPTIARLGCTYIMMHMRGTPATMQTSENTSYPNGLIPTIARELRQRLYAAQEAGIRRWRIILDPGLGFAKTVDQNVELLRNFSELRNATYLAPHPWLVGSSRKGFIGKITGVEEAKERMGGTAATVTAAVQGGAEIVRVHDVKEMAQVVRMADAMYRSG